MKLIDEARKLVYVKTIIDATHFAGVWRDQIYECRALPSTANLTVGSAAFCHVLPGSTELVAVFPPSGEELWFSPGLIYPGSEHSELWVLTEGQDTPVLVWTSSTDWEYITHITWCKADNTIYVFTWDDLDTPDGVYGIRVYRVNQAARTLTLVASHLTAVWGADNTDPVVDVAEFDGDLYCMTGGYANWGNVWKFDPVADTLTHFRHFAEENGYGFGITTNAARDTLIASDGVNVYTYTIAGGWVYDEDLSATFGAWDNMALLTDPENDLSYHGLTDSTGRDVTIGLRTNVTGVWTKDFDDDPPNTVGVDTLCNKYVKATGALEATYGGAWGWGYDDASGTVYRKSPGGAWATDVQLPYTWIVNVERMEEYFLSTQGLAAMGDKLYVLSWHLHYIKVGAVWVAQADNAKARLWRRESAGNYTMIWQSAESRVFLPTHGDCTGMCRAPKPSAAAAEYALIPYIQEAN